MTEAVRTERRGAILEITLDRPKANAIDARTSRELGAAFMTLRDDPTLRVGIVTGAGERFFSAGWDLKAAAGGGFELALACDLIIAVEERTQLFLPEVTIGLIPDSGGVLRLPRRLPRAIATEMLLTGRRMPAEEAMKWGLVNQVVSGPELLPHARSLAEQIARAAPLAVAAIKEVLRATEQLSVEHGYAALRSGRLGAYERMLTSEDIAEGPRAFAEGREPRWQGA